MLSKRSTLAVLFVALLMVGPLAQAQQLPLPGYPAKPVKIIVPFPAGGTTDIVARLVSKGITAMWGEGVVIDNKSGASGMIGAAEGARAAPDGYTLTLGNNQTHSTNATLFKKPAFDTLKDVTPIAMLTRTKHVLVVPAESPIKSYADLIALGKKQPLNYGTSSAGSSSHILSETLRRLTGIDATAVPYRGAAPLMQALLGSQIDFTLASYGSATAYLRSGKLRALAISGDKRDAELPSVPTFNELGVKAASLESWIALYAPAKTPPAIVKAWSDAVGKIMADPETAEALKTAGFEASYKSSEEMRKFHPAEVQRWAKEVKASQITLE